MPLHLLGKKSWNVYSVENIERVKRDEAAAAARDRDEEEQMQKTDAQKRIHILRNLSSSARHRSEMKRTEQDSKDTFQSLGEICSWRTPSENETDRDIRSAKDFKPSGPKVSAFRGNLNYPLTDSMGHISLFSPDVRHQRERNPEAVAEEMSRAKELEDRYTLRFSNAVGFRKDPQDNPWYLSANAVNESKDKIIKSLGSNAHSQETIATKRHTKFVPEDPLEAMQTGIKVLKRVNRERRKWKQEKRKEIQKLETQVRRDKPPSKSISRHQT